MQCGSAGAVLEDSEDSTWEAREGLAVEWLYGYLFLGLAVEDVGLLNGEPGLAVEA